MSEGESENANKPLPRIGSYHLIQPLGTGGMSSVFKAVHVETGHEVAVKVLPRALAKNTTLLQRFIREAKSAESLEHPTIVSIYDRGVDQGRHYLVLEYVEGGDLHDRVRNGGPLELEEAIAAIRTIASGLQFASSRGLIHRDIKPANLLMTPSKQVKIIDLGLALQAENEDERVTREGTTVGTVDYMSPEQARDSRATSERSDIYSLGCTFYFLLTGSPPFPGGDISDKLSRHALEAVPDVRKLRPETPASLANLIRRMMAKRPENRFANYPELIEALDAVSLALNSTNGKDGAGEPILFALVDEDESDSLGIGQEQEPPGEPLFALIDDAEDAPTELPSGVLRLLDDRQQITTPARNSPAGESLSHEPKYSLAELAPLEESEPREYGPRKPSAEVFTRERTASPGLLAQALNEDEDDQIEESVSLGGSRRYDDPIKKIVLTYSLIGLAFIVFTIGVHQLYLASLPAPSLVKELEEEAQEPLVERVAPPQLVEPETEPTRPPSPRIEPVPPPEAVASAALTQPTVTRWTEPSDPVQQLEPELTFNEELEHEFIPSWARTEIPGRLPGHFSIVRRVSDPKDPSQKHTLRLALETIGGTVEIADNGPFFEDDLRTRGDSLLIRGREGFRPIISIEAPQLDVVREQLAVFVLDGKQLILDGLDLVVAVDKLPANQNTLFEVKGAQLTLRRCTVTVLNPRRKPFALFRSVAGEGATRIRLEETLLRGSAFTALNLNDGASNVVLNRSVIVGGRGPIIRSSVAESGIDRTVHLVRSLTCGRGPLLELERTGDSSHIAPFEFRSIGSTCAQQAGEVATSLIITTPLTTKPDELVRWIGHRNVFSGWQSWMSSDGGRTVKVSNLTSARTIWSGLDAVSREDPSRWRLRSDVEQVVPKDLLQYASECAGTLSRVARPTPSLLELTVESFQPPAIPALVPVASKATPAQASKTVAGLAGSKTSPVVVVERKLSFNLSAGPWYGDLGHFLRDQIQSEDLRLRVTVLGSGAYFSTPIRLRDGVSLIIEADPSRAADAAPIIWSAVKDSAGEALIDVRGGDLVLTNLRLTRDGGSRLKHLVRVDGGNLVLNRCWLTAPGVSERNGGNLISFNAPSTEPRPEAKGEGPFRDSLDRPVCWIHDTLLLTGGNAIQAEIGRGLIALGNCALAVGKSAFDLQPAKVARNRFDAALSIHRCTIASEGRFVNLGTWPGSDPGPDRPWLVSTSDSAFLASYERSGVSTESVLLRVEANSLDRGALFWQSSNDAFDVLRFTTQADLPHSTPFRPDVHRQWVKLWGEVHMRNVTGLFWTKGSVISTPSVKLYVRLQSGRVMPADLELDRSYHPGRPRLNLGADLARLQVTLRKHDRR